MTRHQELDVAGVRHTVDIRGRSTSPKMVLLHALGEGRHHLDTVADHFAASFEVFTPDLRGHGDSDWPGHYSFEAMYHDVTGLLDVLGLASVVLVGHSMGGVVSYLVALDRPDLVERLIVEDVSPPYERDQPVPAPPPDTRGLPFDWPVVPAIISEVNAGAREVWARLDTIEAPTLVIGGGEQSHIPQDKLRDVGDRIPRCDVLTIAAGHHVHANQPGQFVEAVAAWLSGQPPPGG